MHGLRFSSLKLQNRTVTHTRRGTEVTGLKNLNTGGGVGGGDVCIWSLKRIFLWIILKLLVLTSLEKTHAVKYWHLNTDTLNSYWIFLKSLTFHSALNIFYDLQNSISIKWSLWVTDHWTLPKTLSQTPTFIFEFAIKGCSQLKLLLTHLDKEKSLIRGGIYFSTWWSSDKWNCPLRPLRPKPTINQLWQAYN